LSCDGASVRLTRRTPTGLQVVAWTLRPDANGSTGNGTLKRWAGPSVTTTGELQDSWLRSLQLQGGEPGQLRTLSGLAQWQIYFYQGNAWSNCQSTGDVASTTGTSTSAGTGTTTSTTSSGTVTVTGTATSSTRVALPNGVRLVLSFAPGSGLAGELTRDVLLGP
jgi:general secretion pathway protein J